MRVFVPTGAGLSAESGIPAFRDAQTGLWARHDPMRLATPEAFVADPALGHRFNSARRAAVLADAPNAVPNAAVWVLTRLQAGLRAGLYAAGGDAVLCRQNVDERRLGWSTSGATRV